MLKKLFSPQYITPIYFLLVAALSWVLISNGMKKWKSTHAIDYFQFWVAGQATQLKDIRSIYSLTDRIEIQNFFLTHAQESHSSHEMYCVKFRPVLELAGTPLLYSVFYLMASGNYDHDYGVYRKTSLLCFYTALVFLILMLRLPLWSLIPCILIFTDYFYPFAFDVRLGNVNQIQLLAISMIALSLKYRTVFFNIFSGVLCSFLLMFKPSLAPFILLLAIFWFSQKSYVRLLQIGIPFVLTSASCVAITHHILEGKALWSNWASDFQEIIFMHKYAKKSLLSFLFGIENEGILSGFNFLFIFISASLIAWKTYDNRKYNREKNILNKENNWLTEFCIINIGILASLVAGVLVHGHYFVLVIPAALLTLHFRFTGLAFKDIARDATFWLWAVALFLIASQPLFKEMDLVQHRHQSLWTYLGAFILLLLSFIDFFSFKRKATLALLYKKK